MLKRENVYWIADAFVEAKGSPWTHLDLVRHHGHTVQRGLSIEQDNVTIVQMPLDNISWLYTPLQKRDPFSLARLVVLEQSSGDQHTSERTCSHRVFLRDLLLDAQTERRRVSKRVMSLSEDLSVENALLEVGYVVLIDALRIRQCFGNVQRNCQFVDAEIRIWRNDGPSTEIHSFPTQIPSESSRFAFQPLNIATDINAITKGLRSAREQYRTRRCG